MRRAALIVVVFGGNAMIKEGEAGTPEQQIRNVYAACRPLVGLLAAGVRMVLVHGNGPQVGLELEHTHLPLDACVAGTQGMMGYFLELALRRALFERGLSAKVATLATMVRVDENDPAFAAPHEPIGKQQRRLVASPMPLEILDLDAVATLLDAGYLVIAGGGGGVPVVKRSGGVYTGVEAVIDKDHTASLIGRLLGARELIDLTAVDFVYRDYGTDRARPIEQLTVAEVRGMLSEGQFLPGTMGSKMLAACSFLEGGGESVLITSMARLDAALRGEIGTHIRPNLGEATNTNRREQP
jgi:carbamate kinase